MPSGITSVTSRLSPRRTVSSISMRVWYRIAFAFTSVPSRTTLAGEPQEHVLQRTPTRAQLTQERALLGQQRGSGGRVDEVVPGPQFPHRARRQAQVRGERVDRQAGDRGERGLLGCGL